MLSHHTRRTTRVSKKSRRTIRSAANAWRCEALEDRRLLAVSLVLGGAQTVVPGATINVSADGAAGQSEMSLVINPTNPLNLVGFSHRLSSPIVMDVYRSVNGGTTWTTTRIDNTDDGAGVAENRFDPAVAFDANGRLYIAYGVRGVAGPPGTTSRLIAAVSTDGGLNFTNFRQVDSQNDIGGAGGSPPGVDRWTLATGRDAATGVQACYMTYTQNVTEGANTDQRIVISGTRDGGANWTAPAILNDGSIIGLSTGGLSAAPAVSFGGELFVTWWDTGTSVLADRDRDGLWANTFNFGADLTVRTNAGIGNVNGAPAQPERGVRFSPSLAINSFTRDLYVTFHERFGAAGIDTDIMFGRSSDFGDTWTWVRAEGSTGTDFNPWIAWDEDSGAIGIAYYSTEGDQATGNDDVRPRMALSTDNGNNWTRTFLSTQTSNEGPGGPGGAGYGGDYLEYNGFAFRDGTAHHLWASRYPGGGTDLDAFTTRISLDSATNGNVLRMGGIGGAPDDSTVIRRSPLNNNFIEVFENNVRTYTGLLASIDSITIETGGGVHAFSFENLPAIPVNMLGGIGADVITISSLSGVSGLTVSGGDGADTLTLGTGAFDANTINAPVSFIGGAGGDTLVIGSGNADAVAAPVSFDGGAGGGNSIIYNDQSPTYSINYDVSPTGVNRDGINQPFLVAYSNTQSITINGSAGADTIFVRNGVNASLFAFGNNGNDNFIRGDGNVTATSGAVFNGGNGIDRITFDDHLRPGNLIWDVHDNEVIYGGLILFETTGFESVGILAGNGNDEITFGGNLSQSFNIDGGGGNETFIIGFQTKAQFLAPVTILGGAGNDAYQWTRASNNWYTLLPGVSAYPVLLDGGSGYNTLAVDDTTRTAAGYYLYDDRFYSTDGAPFPVGMDVRYDNMQAMSLSAGGGTTNVGVYGTSSDIDPGNQISIALGGGNDNVYLYPHNAQGGLTINGNVGIGGGAGADSLFVDDSASSVPAAYAFANPFGAGTQNVTGVGSGGFGIGSDFEAITMTGSVGDDVYNVDSYKSGMGLTINGGLGDDVCNFGNNDVAANVTSIASFLFNGEAGTDTFNLRNANPANSFTYTAAANTTLQVSRTFPSSYFVSLEYYNTEQKAVYAGPAVDIMNITSFASGELSFHGAGGDDALNLPTSSELLGRRVNFFGGAGAANRINQVTNSKTTPSTLHVAQNTIGAFAGDTFFAPGGSVFFDAVQVVNLRLGSGADTAYLHPDAVAAISIVGGNPTAAPGDSLNLALASAANYVVNGTPASGNVTSSNLQTLSYTGFETGPNVDDVAPVVVNADINIDGIPAFADGGARRQAIDVQFSEDVSALIAPASLALMNLTTNEPIPSANVAVEYDLATNTAHFTFPGFADGVLPDGDYEGRVLAGLPDFFGNGLPGDAEFSFFFMQGDANRDRRVNLADFNILAANFGTTSGAVFSQADFNYDGSVNLQDFNILASRFGNVMDGDGALARGQFSPIPIAAAGRNAQMRRLLTMLNDELS